MMQLRQLGKVGMVLTALTVVLWLRSNSASAQPLMLSRAQAKLGAGNVAAIYPNGKRLYLGERYNTEDDRLSLLVLTLNEKGEVVGEARSYRDSALALPEKGRSSITAITPDARHKKLFVAYALDGAGAGDENRNLSVYDLDENGEPVGNSRSYVSGNPRKSLLDFAVHPRLDLLYNVGWGDGAVHVYTLDKNGEPQGEPKSFPAGGQGKYQVAISSDGKRLYLGTYPDRLEVLDLDENGFPTGKPRTFQSGDGKEYLTFAYSPRALFFKKATENGPRVAVWPLGEDGDPIGEPHVRDDVPISVLAVDDARKKLWVGADDVFQDAFSGKSIAQGVALQSFPINADGSLGAKEESLSRSFRQSGVALAAGGGRAVLITEPMKRGVLGNRVKDYRARATLLEAKLDSGEAPAKVALRITRTGKGAPKAIVLPAIAVGETTEWANLDDVLKDLLGQQVVTLAGPSNLAQMKLRVEVAEGDPANGGQLLQTMTEEVLGNGLIVLLPGYGFDPPEQRVAAIELLSDHAKMYFDAASKVALKPDERPHLFNVSAHQLLGGQGSLTQLQRQAGAISMLGFNTINAYSWGKIPAEKIDATLDSLGLERRTSAVYAPPSYFAYDTEKMNPEALLEWAAKYPAGVAKTNGGAPADVVTHYLADEPGWYYPTMLERVRDNPQWLETFRAYLREKGLKPEDLGQTAWEAVLPIGASEGAKGDAPLGTRHLFYWTMRFFPESAARGTKAATEALRKVYGHRIDTTVNWNNWLSNWYGPSPGQKIANNPIIGPDSAYGSMDWFENGRVSANTLWTEDWFGDSSAQNWSLYADLLRSASMLGESRFGGYVIGASTGAFPSGAKYKILSLLGHGGKSLDMFTFGPEMLFPGNCWSEGLNRYGPIADALRLVGRSERLLYPGEAERGKVAILVPSASRLWEAQRDSSLYQGELWGLHAALMHAGYAVDFVDDVDLAGTDWSKRGYTTLYITAPNIAAAAQQKIVDWTRAGGTLVATPGAGAADEYNSLSTLLDPVLGVQNRLAVREAAPKENAATDKLTAKDARFASAAHDLSGPVAALQLTTASPLSNLQSGGAAISGNAFGKGRGIAYGFFPGHQYWLSPDRSDRARLPSGWDKTARQIIVAPAQIADTPRSVTLDREEVEAVRLQSDKGIAITLLNWTGEPISQLSVTLPNIGKFRKVSSAAGAKVQSTLVGGALKITLPLMDVDVLMVE